ncbi:MAG: ZIP family metal transporter [Patescibacteria group bacterium]
MPAKLIFTLLYYLILGYNGFMSALIYSLISALVISAISLVGVFSLTFSEKLLNKVLIWLVSFSAGTLMGGAFFHLLPETLAGQDYYLLSSVYLLVGFCLFFILERILRWHHCHELGCGTHKFIGQMNLIGDGFHNIIDGLVIVSAFSVSPALGVPVTISLAFHEIPQEIGDFGVLLYSGFSKTRALLYNFFTALTALAGVLIGYFLLDQIDGVNQFLLAFAAGGFIYIAASDLIPELHKEENLLKSFFSFLVFLFGLIFMYLIKLWGVE